MIKRTADISVEDYSKIMGTNVESPFHITQIAYPLLKACGNTASIVFISSLAGSLALPALSVYGASKGKIMLFDIIRLYLLAMKLIKRFLISIL